MKLIKMFSFFMFAMFCCNTYAHENKYIFVGQNGNGESAKTAFLLEISAEELNDAVRMNENGEIYLKADRVVAIPKQEFMNFVGAGSSNSFTSEGALHKIEYDNESWRCSACDAMNASWRTSCRVCNRSRP